MTSRTRAVMTILVAGLLAFSGLPFHAAQRDYSARGAWEPATDDNPGFVVPAARVIVSVAC